MGWCAQDGYRWQPSRGTYHSTTTDSGRGFLKEWSRKTRHRKQNTGIGLSAVAHEWFWFLLRHAFRFHSINIYYAFVIFYQYKKVQGNGSAWTLIKWMLKPFSQPFRHFVAFVYRSPLQRHPHCFVDVETSVETVCHALKFHQIVNCLGEKIVWQIHPFI